MVHLSVWRRESLRTNLWLVPSILVVAAIGLFIVTDSIDHAAADGTVTLPAWVNSGSPDAARQILTAIAAAVITVVGLVFSITIVALTLASTQFGPRMLRNFIRDRGTQLTLGAFVATFVFAILALASVGSQFVPHLTITVLLALTLGDLAILIYFIHHVAKSIQLPEVIAGIARDLSAAIEVETHADVDSADGRQEGPSVAEILARLEERGAPVAAPRSGYLQYVDYATLTKMASSADAVIRMLHRPGHFVAEGLPLARVWPPEAAPAITRGLARNHVTGPNRTLSQDLALAIDQMVEIAIRALSSAVNDTFSALACIDWLGDGLCQIATRWHPRAVHRDRAGYVRVITAQVAYSRFVERSFDKVRQSGRGMPAVLMRQLEALARVMVFTKTPEQRAVLLHQADMILASSEESVPEPADRLDVRGRYDLVLAAMAEVERSTPAGQAVLP